MINSADSDRVGPLAEDCSQSKPDSQGGFFGDEKDWLIVILIAFGLFLYLGFLCCGLN